MSNGFENPSDFAAVNDKGSLTVPWRLWITRVHNLVAAMYMSGPTASRPTKLLWVGRQFWDTDLQKPVYVSSVNPAVWKDASGAVV